MSETSISHGLLDPLARMGFGVSAGIEMSDGTKLFAIFETKSRRIMIVAHPARAGDIANRLPPKGHNKATPII